MDHQWWPDAGVQHLHMIHRAWGVATAIITTVAAVQVARRAKSWPAIRTLAMIAPLLVVGQVLLGIATVMSMRAVPLAVGHFAGAASLWALWMSSWLITAPRTTGAHVPAVSLPQARSLLPRHPLRQ